MAPFIKASVTEHTPTGNVEKLHFLNADHIARATFNKSTGELEIFLISEPAKIAFRIRDDEAKEALTVLQKL